MVGGSVAVLAAGFALQLAMYSHGGHVALSDLPRVLVHRHIGPGALPYIDRVLEYPVGSGVLLYVASVVSSGPLGALAVTAAAAAALWVALTVALERRFGARAWRWAIGVPVFLYAFQNWDVFAVAAMLAALWAYERRSDRVSGSMIAVGAAVKLFPAVLLPPLVALRWARGDRRGALRVAAWAVGGFAVLNLPILLAHPSGWWWGYAFQSRRQATWGTAWFYVFRVFDLPVNGTAGAQLANVVALVALGAGMTWLTLRARRGSVGPEALAAAAVAIFLVSNKVYSPTYDLWLVPFFVLLPLSRRMWLAFCATDLAVFVTVYGYFHGFGSISEVRVVLPVLVLARTVILLRFISRAMQPRVVAHQTYEPTSTDVLLSAA
jgi:uncharacterized membrane protein